MMPIRKFGFMRCECPNRFLIGNLILDRINDLLGNWDHWCERRAQTQALRQRSDAEIFQLFHKPLWCIEDEERYQELHYGAAEFFGVTELFRGLTATGSEPKK